MANVLALRLGKKPRVGPGRSPAISSTGVPRSFVVEVDCALGNCSRASEKSSVGAGSKLVECDLAAQRSRCADMQKCANFMRQNEDGGAKVWIVTNALSDYVER
jgi:hypothetical protein